MKVFLKEAVQGVGEAGKIINVSDGYAINFLLPRGLAVEVTAANEKGFINRQKNLQKREEVIEAKTSQLAEKVKSLKVVIACKAHDVDKGTTAAKLYGALGAAEVVTALAEQGVAVSKSQIVFEKAIKTTGVHPVTIKLSNKLQPKFMLKVVAE